MDQLPSFLTKNLNLTLSETATAKWDTLINWVTNVKVWLTGKSEDDMAQEVDNG